MSKIYVWEEVLKKFADGQTIMIGGFAHAGIPARLIDGLVETGAKNLTIISNDPGEPGLGVGKLFSSRQVSRFICSHIGMNPDVGQQMNVGEVKVDLTPQGSLAEKIRCGGAGLGGVLVQTGIGTIIEQSRKKIVVNDRSYLLEEPLHADIALVKAWKADALGNLLYRGTARNFNPLMAMAASLVIVEADEIVPVGSIDPSYVMTPGIFVQMILENGGQQNG